jgi:ABC-2 type transport system permease protein
MDANPEKRLYLQIRCNLFTWRRSNMVVPWHCSTEHYLAPFMFSQSFEFFRFELRQQLRHPSFWIALAACIAVGAVFVATSLGELEVGAGRVPRNVPYAVVRNLVGLSAIGMFVVFISVSKAAMRDFNTNAAPLVFSLPVRMRAYLAGRFAAGFLTGLLAVLAGTISMAWTQIFLADGNLQMAALSWISWVFGLFLLVIPNLLFISALVYLIALWSRSMGVTFLGLLAITIGQDIAEVIPPSIFGYRLPALLDPLGLAALNSVTRTWSVIDYTQRIPTLEGDLLWNRLLWLSLSLVFLFLAGPIFALRARRADYGQKRKAWSWGKGKARKRNSKQVLPTISHNAISSGRPSRHLWLTQVSSILRLEILCLSRSLAWRILLGFGVAAAILAVTQGHRLLGVLSLPGGPEVAFAIERSTRVIMTLFVVLFSGEVVWRERSTRMDLTLDALPIARGVLVTGKILALVIFVIGSVGVLAVAAVATQSAQGGGPVSIHSVWIPVLNESLGYLQLAAVALLLQTIAGARLSGYLAMALFLSLRLWLKAEGLNGALYSIASVRLPFLSEMNGWSSGLQRVGLIHGYWICCAACMVIATALLWPHGQALGFKQNLLRARQRSRGAVAWTGLLGIGVSLGLGLWIQATTLAPGTGWNQTQLESFRANYEQEFKSWQGSSKPAVVAIEADVDLNPERRHVAIKASYSLENQSSKTLQETLLNFGPDFKLLGLNLSESNSGLVMEQAGLGTRVLKFDPPLAPGSSAVLHFELEFAPSGLGAYLVDRWLVDNGTFLLGGTGTHPFFLGGHFFPSFGYDSSRELIDLKARSRFGLQPWAPLMSAADYEQQRAPGSEMGLSKNAEGEQLEVFGSDDWASLDLWIHTPADQIPVAPGELLEHYVENGRAHHHFRTAKKIQAFFSILSGRYEIQSAKQGNVDVEIYYHLGHEARVAHILWAAQQALAYFEKNWGPYPHQVLRLGEIPGEAGFAASLPGVIAFGEDMAFTSPAGDGQPLHFPAWNSKGSSAADVDPILWVVSHEVAHQWWDGHVLPGLALGASLTSETLAQYGSLAVIHNVYGNDAALRVAKYDLDSYLTQRSRAPRQERSLMDVDDQAHLHYGKGMVVFHALAEVAGYETIDRALSKLVQEFGGPNGAPITSINLMQALEAEWPVQHRPMLQELLAQIAFVETSVSIAEVRPREEGGYLLVVECEVHSVTANGDGAEQPLLYEGLMELSITFGKSPTRQQVVGQVKEGRVRFETYCNDLPTRVHVDPRMLHIDRNLNDNEAVVTETNS